MGGRALTRHSQAVSLGADNNPWDGSRGAGEATGTCEVPCRAPHGGSSVPGASGASRELQGSYRGGTSVEFAGPRAASRHSPSSQPRGAASSLHHRWQGPADSTRAYAMSILVVGENLEVLDANPAGRRLVERGTLFEVRGGRLVCASESNASYFRRLVKRACRAGDPGAVRPAGVRLSPSEGPGSADVIVAPAPTNPSWGRAALVLVDSSQTPPARVPSHDTRT